MNSQLAELHSYPFEKLRNLLAGVVTSTDHPAVSLGLGEPQYPAPPFIAETLSKHLLGISKYPLTKGLPELRLAIAHWLQQRFQLPAESLDPETQVLPVNGTREALFAIAQAVVNSSSGALVAMSNPFYQIYEGAALLAGAEPYYLNTTEESNFLPDFNAVPAEIWQRCQLIYVCSPNNPTGSVMSMRHYQTLLKLANQYDFVIASDECYSEIYLDESQPPCGLLQAAQHMGQTDFKHCLVFNSLSKRSSVPGLRSGFVAGDADVIAGFLRYRTYHGCAMPLPIQHASIAAWQDEQHVAENRNQYQQVINHVTDLLKPVLSIEKPAGGFFLWAKTPCTDTDFAKALFTKENITVLPGQYLSRESQSINPGSKRVRMAMVHPYQLSIDTAQRIKQFVDNNEFLI